MIKNSPDFKQAKQQLLRLMLNKHTNAKIGRGVLKQAGQP